MATSPRYLGVMIDEKRNGMAHFTYIKESSANYVRATHSLSRRNWGLSGDVLKHLYKNGIERLATYACNFWWTGTACMRDSLVSSQRLALLAITRWFHTTSTTALMVLAGTLSLDLQVEKESLLGRTLRLIENMSIDDIFIQADEIQFKAENWCTHSARSP